MPKRKVKKTPEADDTGASGSGTQPQKQRKGNAGKNLIEIGKDQIWNECDKILRELAPTDVVKINSGILNIIQKHSSQ